MKYLGTRVGKIFAVLALLFISQHAFWGTPRSFAFDPDSNSGANVVPEGATSIKQHRDSRWIIYDRGDQTDWLKTALPEVSEDYQLAITFNFLRIVGVVVIEIYGADPYEKVIAQKEVTDVTTYTYTTANATDHYIKLFAKTEGSLAHYEFSYVLTPTLTPIPTVTATPTVIPSVLPTTTPIPPTATPVSLIASTATPAPPTPTPIPTVFPITTPSPSIMPTLLPTATPTAIPTFAVTSTPTLLPSPTVTPTSTPTRLPSPTAIPSSTPTSRPTATPIAAIISAATSTPVLRVTPTPYPTPSPTIAAGGIITEEPPSAPITESPPPLWNQLWNQVLLRRDWLLLGGGVALCLIIIFMVIMMLVGARKRVALSDEIVQDITSAEYKLLGDLAVDGEKLPLAEKCYRKAAELEPYNKNMYYDLGVFFFQTGRYKEAIRELHKYLSCEIIRSEAYSYLAYSYLHTENFGKAEEYFKKALKLDSDDPYTYVGLGVIKQSRKHYTQAKTYYEKALELDPNCQEAQKNLRRLHFHLWNEE